ncbi:MAG: MoaD/ThiS family protein [Oscillospiraceae bacterium]|nr:MoaD/ThiS family protein [Oscillospiraceae bacterium]
MKLEVRLFSYLRDGRGKEVYLDVKEDAIVADVIKMLEIEDNEVANVLINNFNADSSSTLKEGDSVSLFPLLAGG